MAQISSWVWLWVHLVYLSNGNSFTGKSNCNIDTVLLLLLLSSWAWLWVYFIILKGIRALQEHKHYTKTATKSIAEEDIIKVKIYTMKQPPGFYLGMDSQSSYHYIGNSYTWKGAPSYWIITLVSIWFLHNANRPPLYWSSPRFFASYCLI